VTASISSQNSEHCKFEFNHMGLFANQTLRKDPTTIPATDSDMVAVIGQRLGSGSGDRLGSGPCFLPGRPFRSCPHGPRSEFDRASPGHGIQLCAALLRRGRAPSTALHARPSSRGTHFDPAAAVQPPWHILCLWICRESMCRPLRLFSAVPLNKASFYLC
jgi:hypothetical protein